MGLAKWGLFFFFFFFHKNTTSRVQQRFIPYGLDVGRRGLHWVSGGSYDGPTSTSEVFDGDGFSASVDLPVPTYDHCATVVGDSEAIILTGEGKIIKGI